MGLASEPQASELWTLLAVVVEEAWHVFAALQCPHLQPTARLLQVLPKRPSVVEAYEWLCSTAWPLVGVGLVGHVVAAPLILLSMAWLLMLEIPA